MKEAYLKIIYKILAFYARRVISDNNPKIIAVTGSVGKTSTKDAIYEVLHNSYGSDVRKTEGNLNAEIGIPLTIFGYKKVPNKFVWPFFLLALSFKKFNQNYPKYLVIEMGVEKAGDIDYFTSIVRPDIAVITSVTGAHVANFKDLPEYRAEKLSLLTKIKPGGKAIVNADDPILAQLKTPELLKISAEKKADYFADAVNVSLSGTDFRINCTGHKISVKSQLLGRQMIYSQLFAFALGDLLHIPTMEIGKALAKIKPISGRMNLIEGKNDIEIIDDTYNSNPTSLAAALQTLEDIKYQGRKVAIIGNMNELGQMEKPAHEEIAKFAKGKCDLAVFAGPNAEAMAKAFGKNSLAFKNRLELVRQIDKIIQKNDLILIKASQNKNFFEEVVKVLMKNPGDANRLLVRQGNFWKRKKFVV